MRVRDTRFKFRELALLLVDRRSARSCVHLQGSGCPIPSVTGRRCTTVWPVAKDGASS